MKPKILYLRSHLGRFAAQKARQREDFGLPAILEKMNFLFTPLNSGPFWDISRKFQKFLIISQSSLQHENQWKLTLVFGIGILTTSPKLWLTKIRSIPSRAGVCFVFAFRALSERFRTAFRPLADHFRFPSRAGDRNGRRRRVPSDQRSSNDRPMAHKGTQRGGKPKHTT